MIDIAINNSGDLVSQRPIKASRLKLFWNTSANESLRLVFRMGRNWEDVPSLGSLKLEFNTGKDITSPSCPAVHDEEELRQRIIVLLRTELGDLAMDPSYGTSLIQQKHKDITSSIVQAQVHDIVYNAVEDLLDDPSVVVKRMKNETKFSCQNLNIYIYDGKKEIYEFELEAQ